MGCRICRLPKRSAIEASVSSVGAAPTAAKFGISERSLERHLRHRSENGVCAISSGAPADEETPPTSRCPVLGPTSGVRVTVDVDDRAVASAVLPELQELRALYASGVEAIDRMIAHWRSRAEAA